MSVETALSRGRLHKYPTVRDSVTMAGVRRTMSEMELSVLRQRSLEALRQKARRGELFMTVAIGYVRIGNNRIEKYPDRRVAEAIALVFTKFGKMQSVRQVHLWLRHERIPLPAVCYGVEDRMIEWKLPVPRDNARRRLAVGARRYSFRSA